VSSQEGDGERGVGGGGVGVRVYRGGDGAVVFGNMGNGGNESGGERVVRKGLDVRDG